MKKQLRMVKDFQKVFENQELKKIPEIPSLDIVKLRLSLLQEELDELKTASKANDLIEISDALGDMLYILLGTVNVYGMNHIFEDIFNDIHVSNMSKLDLCKKDAEESIRIYQEKGIECFYRTYTTATKQIKYIIYRKSDSKVLKSHKYNPVNLTKYFNVLPS